MEVVDGTRNAPVDGEFQLLFVVRDGRVYIGQCHSELRPQVPSQTAADDTGPECIESRVQVLQRDGEILRQVLQEHYKRVHCADVELLAKYLVDEYIWRRCRVGGCVDQGKVLRITSSQELQGHLHGFFTSRLGPREAVENDFTMGSEKLLPLTDSLDVCVFELEPPVGFHLPKRCGLSLVQSPRKKDKPAIDNIPMVW